MTSNKELKTGNSSRKLASQDNPPSRDDSNVNSREGQASKDRQTQEAREKQTRCQPANETSILENDSPPNGKR